MRSLADDVTVAIFLAGLLTGLLAGVAYGWQYREEWKRGVRSLLGLDPAEEGSPRPAPPHRTPLLLVLGLTAVTSAAVALVVDDRVARAACGIGAVFSMLALLVVLLDPRWADQALFVQSTILVEER